jgi:acyl-CoA thioester hydrolase
MADFTITYRGTVYPAQCDHMGHMNVMWYVGKFDEASWHLLASVGLSPSRMRTEAFDMVAVEQDTQYKRELRAGDVLTVRSSVLEVREKSVRLRHEMMNEDTGELAAITEVVGVCMDLTTRRSRPIPLDIHERVASTIAGEGCHAIREASGQRAAA